MKDQHKKIAGYRDLSQEEINLMNRIKVHAELTSQLLNEVKAMREDERQKQVEGSHLGDQNSESMRCLAIAKTNLQTGQMWFVRAVALPESF